MSSPTTPALPSAALPAVERSRGVSSPPGVERLPGDEQGSQSFSFSDFLSVINPLQHIPIVGTIYRAITGDTIAPAARVIGGALFGGPIGLVASAFNAIIEQTTGKDLGDQMLALVVPDSDKLPTSPQPTEQYAVAAPPGAPEKASEARPTAAPLAADPGTMPPPRTAAATQSAPLVDRTPLNASLTSRHDAVDGSRARGRTLADYRSFAGRPLPTIDATRSASTAAPVRLQTTAPMVPERGRTPVLPVRAANADEISPSAPANVLTTGEGGADTPQTHWFQAAMMKGLDRYREGRRPDAARTPQLDTTL